MQKINLYIFSESNKSLLYGIGTYIRELTSSLRKDLFNITLIQLNSTEEQINIQENEGIKLFSIPAAKEQAFIDDEDCSNQYYRNVVYLLQLYIANTDKLIFHLNCMHSQMLAERLKTAFHCKLVLTIHYLNWSFDPNETPIKDFYLKEKRLFDTVDHIICLSQNTYQKVNDTYKQKPHKSSVVHNGLSDDRQIVKKNELRLKYRLPKVPIILFVGRLDEMKGLKFLIKAFKKVLKIVPNCRLIISGNGDFQTYMEECLGIWTNVTFTGLINKENLYELYSLADIGVMTSFHEQCSYVAIEMMMHGLPLIGTTAIGLSEMIEEGGTGLHIPIERYPDKVAINTTILAEKIIFLLNHPKEMHIMGENGRKRYEKMYTSEIFGQNMLRLLHSLTKEVTD